MAADTMHGRAATEVEAKFLVRRFGQVAQVLAALTDLGYKVSTQPERSHTDTYIDTRDWAILHTGWALRLRQGENAVLTLKSVGAADGALFIRDEIEQPLPSTPMHRPARLPAGPLRDLLGPVIASKRRSPLFTISTQRSVYLATGKNVAVSIELDFDRSHVVVAKAAGSAPAKLTFTELELELKTGTARELEKLSRVIRDRVGLVPARLSKFERGIQALGLTIGEVLQATPEVELRSRDPMLDLLYRYLRRQVSIIERQEPLAWEGIDPEGVHRMRVATRRVRATLKTFDELLGTDAGPELTSELRWLAAELGHARDADISELTVRRFEDEMPATVSAAVIGYADHVRISTVGAYETLVGILDGARYAALRNELANFVERGPGADIRPRFGTLTVTAAAGRYIDAAVRKLIARGDQLGPVSTVEQFHDLRKRAKRLRYMLELFQEVQLDKWSLLIKRLERLQDILGDHQDAVTASAKLSAFVNTLPATGNRDQLVSLGRLLQIEEQRIVDSRRRFKPAWQAFRKAAR